MDQPLRTKIIATMGLKSMSSEVLENMIKAGMNILRCNFVHTTYDQYREVKGIIGEINNRLGTNVKLQADLQGISIRLGTLPEDGIFLQAGQEYTFASIGGEIREGEIPINDATVHQFVKPGQNISFLNGAFEGDIVGVVENRIYVKMINSGTIKTHKSINLPETTFDSHMTEKDHQDLDFLLEEGIDWVALSFVSNKEEINEIRRRIGDRPVKIISKIERRCAVENIDEIIVASDAIMVARGDLGIEEPMQEVPIIQKQLMGLCHHYKKPVIVATQMMLSMVHAKRPTRAEVSDVANAVFDRADAVMLSDETTEGEDPANAVATMAMIVKRAEEYMYFEPNYFNQYWN